MKKLGLIGVCVSSIAMAMGIGMKRPSFASDKHGVDSDIQSGAFAKAIDFMKHLGGERRKLKKRGFATDARGHSLTAMQCRMRQICGCDLVKAGLIPG